MTVLGRELEFIFRAFATPDRSFCIIINVNTLCWIKFWTFVFTFLHNYVYLHWWMSSGKHDKKCVLCSNSVGNPLNTTWTLNSLDCIGLVSVLLRWCNDDVMPHVCNPLASILCRFIGVSFPYMALQAAEPWTKQWHSYSDKVTYQNWTPGQQRFQFQSMEDTVGGLLQPIGPGWSSSWKAGSSVDPKLLPWNANHRRELGTNGRTAQKRQEDYHRHWSIRQRANQRVCGTTCL